MSQNHYDGLPPYLVERVRYHASSMQRHPALRHVEINDLEQELMLWFLSRKHTYDPQKASWRTFVSMVLDYCHVRLIRDAYAQKRGLNVPHVSLSQNSGQSVSEEDLLRSDIQPGNAIHCELCCDLSRILVKLPADLAALLAGLQPLHSKTYHAK